MAASRNDYMTPPWLIHIIESELGCIGLDPCASKEEKYHLGRVNFSGPEGNGKDGLVETWDFAGLVYCNPPYGEGALAKWAPKIALEAKEGNEILALLPAYLERRWWTRHLHPAFDSCLYFGKRIVFFDPSTGKEAEGGSGWFPSVLVYFGDRAKVFERAFSKQGWFFRPVGR